MSEREDRGEQTPIARHPLIRQVGEMTAEATGIRLLIVHPEASGWGQVYGDGQTHLLPSYCRMVKSTTGGAHHCRMCHILMAVAACNGGPSVQQCHAGVSVLVSPASDASDESVAVLSSCLFGSEKTWPEVEARGREMGLDIGALRKAFRELPQPDEKQLALVRSGMRAMGLAIQTVRENRKFLNRFRELQSGSDVHSQVQRFLRDTAWSRNATARAPTAGGDRSLLAHVVCELVRQRPDLPLTVKEIASAARLTPNHFTTLFREHAGVPFTEFLARQRLTRARKLLENPTLSISEIARLVGYDDAGYFSRRFRQQTGHSPREWRKRQAVTGPAEEA